VNPAFLLPALQSIISGVEIRNQHSLITLQKLRDGSSLPRFRQSEHNVQTVREYPDVMINASYAEPGLVYVNKQALFQALPEKRLRATVILGEGFQEIDDACLGRRLMEQVLHSLADRPVRKPKDNPLINRPGPKAVTKRLAAELLNPGRFGASLALPTIALLA
jgi:hypothetical protein